ELIYDSNGKIEIEMFSDHGNRFDEYKHVKLNAAIQAAGFVTEKTLKSERSVVLPKYGLVGSSMLFTNPQNRLRLAQVCASTTGVDFALYLSDENTIELLSRRGNARVIREGERFKYQDFGGDPLDLGHIIEMMNARNIIDKNGFASGEEWWHATAKHKYPDPMRRLFNGFEKYVKNRADVIVSYEDGYLIGSPFLSFCAEMRATHGNMLRGESEGFAMSTRQHLGETLRGYELNRLFALDQRSKAGSFFSGQGHCRLVPALAKSL